MTTTKMKTITGRVVGIHEMTRELGGITPQWLQIEIDVDLDDAGAVQTGDTVLVVRASADDDPLAGVQRWTFDAPDGEEWTADDEFIRIEDARAAVARARTRGNAAPPVRGGSRSTWAHGQGVPRNARLGDGGKGPEGCRQGVLSRADGGGVVTAFPLTLGQIGRVLAAHQQVAVVMAGSHGGAECLCGATVWAAPPPDDVPLDHTNSVEIRRARAMADHQTEQLDLAAELDN